MAVLEQVAIKEQVVELGRRATSRPLAITLQGLAELFGQRMAWIASIDDLFDIHRRERLQLHALETVAKLADRYHPGARRWRWYPFRRIAGRPMDRGREAGGSLRRWLPRHSAGQCPLRRTARGPMGHDLKEERSSAAQEQPWGEGYRAGSWVAGLRSGLFALHQNLTSRSSSFLLAAEDEIISEPPRPLPSTPF